MRAYLQGFLGDVLVVFWAGDSFSSIHLISAPPPLSDASEDFGFTVGTICDGRNCCFLNFLKLGASDRLLPLLGRYSVVSGDFTAALSPLELTLFIKLSKLVW